ncbi:transposase-like protein [Marinitoga litoralis]|nr:transposase-like protein [Marinitoga litoralis]
MYTTNVSNRQYRKVTKNKTSFPNDDALMNILYLATIDATKRWTARYRNWKSRTIHLFQRKNHKIRL